MKRLKVFASLLALTGLVIASFAFTSKSYHSKVVNIVCFKYTGPISSTAPLRPDATDIVNKANWTNLNKVEPNNTDCPTPRQVICAICFDTDIYPLDANGKPPFASGSTFSNTVLAHYNVVTDQGLMFNSITFYFKAYP